ncbi:MAG: hypothetical protein IJP30_05365 [Clostridia bacterium]|nr:hypothetical protein [Clostridia bacterium]
MEQIVLYVMTVIYVIYGILSLFVGYQIYSKRNYSMINGLDPSGLSRVHNHKKFGLDYSLAHFLTGASCLIGGIMVFADGGNFKAIIPSIIVTVLLSFYGSITLHRLPERLRRGRYM